MGLEPSLILHCLELSFVATRFSTVGSGKSVAIDITELYSFATMEQLGYC